MSFPILSLLILTPLIGALTLSLSNSAQLKNKTIHSMIKLLELSCDFICFYYCACAQWCRLSGFGISFIFGLNLSRLQLFFINVDPNEGAPQRLIGEQY